MAGENEYEYETIDQYRGKRETKGKRKEYEKITFD